MGQICFDRVLTILRFGNSSLGVIGKPGLSNPSRGNGIAFIEMKTMRPALANLVLCHQLKLSVSGDVTLVLKYLETVLS